VFAIATPVRKDRAESDSAKMRNDCAVPVVATPLSVTVIPAGTNENTVETTGDRVPANGMIRTFPVCTGEAMPAVEDLCGRSRRHAVQVRRIHLYTAHESFICRITRRI